MTTWRWLMGFIQSLGFVTQIAHMGWGAFIVAALAPVVGPWWAFGLLQLWVLPKELVFDNIAAGEGHGSPDWLDAFFYEIGGLLAVAISLAR